MRVTVHVIGRLKEDYFQRAEAEYLKRLRPYARVEVIEHKNQAALLAALPEDGLVVTLDERGESSLDSEAFARRVFENERMTGRGRPIAFAIGGADGHGPEVRKRADIVLGFGRLTIAHRLVRLLIIEQIYRAFRILAGEPYHR